MTRRLTIAILWTVWATLIAGGAVAYGVTRALLLDYFDESLFAYASSVPGLVHAPGQSPALTSLGGDRYLVVDELSRTMSRPTIAPTEMEPQLLSASSSYPQGQHSRTVKVRAYAVGKSNEPPRAVTVIYTRSATAFDSRMNHLAMAFAVFGIVAGLLAAWVARWVARSALRPLSQTARDIGSIDERQLDRRLDVTALPSELAPMAARLNEMLARLQAAFTARQRFLADASHELRTPVAALVMGMEVALRHPRDVPAYRRIMEACLGDALQLKQLVERLMEQVRSENLSQDESPEETDLTSLFNHCLDSITPLADVRNLTIHRTVPDGMRATVAAGRLRSIVMNLLSNAIEYNRAGGSVSLTCSIDPSNRLNLNVADTGVGIAAEDLARLFEPFFRADNARQGEHAHLGLGLSIVRAHLRAMNGTCEVLSEAGQNTNFRVSIPLTGNTQTASEQRDESKCTSHAHLMRLE